MKRYSNIQEPKISEKCIHNLETAAKTALGESYWPLAKFFLRIFSHSTALRQSGKIVLCAFMTRRCYSLSLIFLDIFAYYKSLPPSQWPHNLSSKELDSLTEDVKSCFITDRNLVYMGDEIAGNYLEHGEFPCIMLVDDILTHGRSVNRVLLELEGEILRWVGQSVSGTDTAMRTQLLESLELQVFAQKNGPSLLIFRYQRRLESTKICDVKQLREYSRRFSLLVSVSNYNNAAYFWSLQLPSKNEEEASPAAPFCKVVTRLDNICQNTFLWYYPTPDRAKAVCTIRWRESQTSDVEGQRLAVPFIFFGDIPAKRLLQLHWRIMEDLSDLDLHFLQKNTALLQKGHKAGLRWVFETDNLVLCSLLSRKFWGDDTVECQPDLAAIAQNFVRFSEIGENSGIYQELERLWTWAASAPDGLLEEYLSLLLEDSAPIWESPNVGELCPSIVALPEAAAQRLTKEIEDVIASISYTSERGAYEKYTASISLSDQAVSNCGKNCSLSDTLRNSLTLWGGRVGIPELSYALGVILQGVDLGLICMRPYIRNGQFRTMLQAGDQARFIKPIRYKKYIPTLAMMKKRCSSGQRELRDEIERFVGVLPCPKPGLAEELHSFVQELDYVHQELGDWNISLPRQLKRKTNKAGTVTFALNNGCRDMLHEQIEYLTMYTGI